MTAFIVFFGLTLAVVGVSIALTPAESLLAWDRRTGRAIYRSAPDHQTGLARARTFYRFFGALIAVLGPTLAAGNLAVAAAA